MILLSLVLLPLLGAIFLYWAQRREDLPVWPVGLAILGLTTVLWFVNRSGLDRPVTLLSDSYSALDLPAWSWQLDETRWWLAGYWLALVLIGRTRQLGTNHLFASNLTAHIRRSICHCR